MLETELIDQLRRELKAEISAECAGAKTEIYRFICGACAAAIALMSLLAVLIAFSR